MFGIDLVMAFFAGLVWWEIILFLILVVSIVLSLNIESTAGVFAAFAVIFFMPWTGVGSIWASITLLSLAWYLILFILVGIGWSFWKWKLLVQENIEYGQDKGYDKDRVKERISNRKDYDTIIYWILLWPFSMTGYFINDFIYNLIKGIVDKIYTVYDRITDKMLGKY